MRVLKEEEVPSLLCGIALLLHLHLQLQHLLLRVELVASASLPLLRVVALVIVRASAALVLAGDDLTDALLVQVHLAPRQLHHADAIRTTLCTPHTADIRRGGAEERREVSSGEGGERRRQRSAMPTMRMG